jgi:hypothetical protein
MTDGRVDNFCSYRVLPSIQSMIITIITCMAPACHQNTKSMNDLLSSWSTNKDLETLPCLSLTLKRWEDTNWKYFFGLPECRSKIWYRPKNPSWSHSCATSASNVNIEVMPVLSLKQEDIVVDTGLSEDDRARVFAMHYWA